MALRFAPVSTNRVDHGSASILDNLAPNKFSGWAWVYVDGTGTFNHHIFTKELTFNGANAFGFTFLIGGSIAMNLAGIAKRTTSDSIYEAPTNTISKNVWTWVAFTYNDVLG